jgi:hypothetical protein
MRIKHIHEYNFVIKILLELLTHCEIQVRFCLVCGSQDGET